MRPSVFPPFGGNQSWPSMTPEWGSRCVLHWMPCKQTPARPTAGTPSDSFRTRGVKEPWKKAPEAPRFPFQARRVLTGRAPPKTHLCRRFLGLRLGEEAEPSSGSSPGRRSLGSCFLGVPHPFRLGGDDQTREPRSQRQERGPRDAGEAQSERLGGSAARTSGG